MQTIKTKWFASAMAGAPAMNGNIGGGLIGVLTACLKDGFNLLTLDSLTVAGNVATGTKAGHGFVVNQVVLIAGATPAALNGEWRVTEVTANTVKFATSGISDQTATGTITIKTAPCGWLVPFTGTNQAVFKSGDVTSTQLPIRVDDSTAQYSTIRAAENFTDISTEVNGYSTQYMKRSNATDANARPWIIISDTKSVYLGIQWTNSGVYDFYHFGDFYSLVAGDAYNFRLQALITNAPATLGEQSSVSDAYCEANSYSMAARPFTQISGGVQVWQGSAANFAIGNLNSGFQWSLSGNRGNAANQNVPAFASPSATDNGFHFTPVFLSEISAGSLRNIRGTARGLLHCIEYLPQTNGYSILSGVENTPGGLVIIARTAGHIRTAQSTYASASATIAFSLGDW